MIPLFLSIQEHSEEENACSQVATGMFKNIEKRVISVMEVLMSTL